MPKIVDHAQRRELIVEAFAAVTRREGLAAASVRSVAAEAGLSPGALRHYFTTQDELTRFAMDSVTERVARRVTDRFATWPEPEQLAALSGDARVALVADVLEETMPLDAVRRAEGEIWLALVVASRTNAGLHDLAGEAHRRLGAFFREMVAVLGSPPDRSARDAAGVHGLVDGLTMQLILYPGAPARQVAQEALRAYLRTIAST